TVQPMPVPPMRKPYPALPRCVLVAEPPAKTYCVPSDVTFTPLARPPTETYWLPPAEIVVERAWPADVTYSAPLKETVVFDVTPEARTFSRTPLPVVKLLSW